MARPENEEGNLDPSIDNHAVRKERGAKQDHILREITECEDVQGVRAMRI